MVGQYFSNKKTNAPKEKVYQERKEDKNNLIHSTVFPLNGNELSNNSLNKQTHDVHFTADFCSFE